MNESEKKKESWKENMLNFSMLRFSLLREDKKESEDFLQIKKEIEENLISFSEAVIVVENIKTITEEERQKLQEILIGLEISQAIKK
jgi:hypothetical protein